MRASGNAGEWLAGRRSWLLGRFVTSAFVRWVADWGRPPRWGGDTGRRRFDAPRVAWKARQRLLPAGVDDSTLRQLRRFLIASNLPLPFSTISFASRRLLRPRCFPSELSNSYRVKELNRLS